MHRSLKVGACLLLAACGSSAKSPKSAASTSSAEPQPTAAELERQRLRATRQELEDERPANPLEVKRRQAFAFPDRCGQGPYRVESEALAADHAESFTFYLCAPRPLHGTFRAQVQEPLTTKPPPAAQSFGRIDEAAHRDCVAGAEERTVQLASEPAPASPAPGGRGAKRKGQPLAGARPPERPASSEKRTLAATAAPLTCQVQTGLVAQTWSAPYGPPLRGARLALELWSAVPNLLDGAVLVLEQRGLPAGATAERWAEYQRAERAWYQRYRALLDEEVRLGYVTLLDAAADAPAPPPPPRRAETPPPRPSRHATWLPGSWHYEDGRYHWLAGLWRVPEEDVRREETAVAPQAPPPPKVEAVAVRPPPPSRRAVWAPGSWQWDGRGYVWIDGTWRIPPSEGQQWTPPAWRPRPGGGVILRPGGWTIRITR